MLPTGGPCALTEAPHGALGMVVQATSLMVAHRFATEVAAYAGRVPETSPERIWAELQGYLET